MEHLISKLLRSAFVLHGILIAILTIPLWIYPEYFLELFVNDIRLEQLAIHEYTFMALKGLWLFFALDGIAWIIAGVLTSGGDTKFIMYVNTINTWVVAVIPALVWTNYYAGTPEITWKYVVPAYGAIAVITLALRYKSNKWHNLKLN